MARTSQHRLSSPGWSTSAGPLRLARRPRWAQPRTADRPTRRKMSSYSAMSPRSSAPWVCKRATVSPMSSTANMTRWRPQRVRRCDPRCRTACRRPVVLGQLRAGPGRRGSASSRSPISCRRDPRHVPPNVPRPIAGPPTPCRARRRTRSPPRGRRPRLRRCPYAGSPCPERRGHMARPIPATNDGNWRHSHTWGGTAEFRNKCARIRSLCKGVRNRRTCPRKYVEISAADRVGGGTCPPARGDSTDVGGVGRGVMV